MMTEADGKPAWLVAVERELLQLEKPYLCAVCKVDRLSHVNAVCVQVGNSTLGFVCEGGCAATARDSVAALLPDSFPEVDEKGFLVV